MKISNEVANVLANSEIDDLKLYLPGEQLERKLYMAVNNVLVALEGKWNRKEKAHIFKVEPAEIIEEILLTGEYTDAKKEYQFFETPDELAKKLVDMANIQPGETVLEPSAGRGAIVKHINKGASCDCIELNLKDRIYLREEGYYVVGEDFLQCQQRYDVIIANPPFSFQSDISHITHMIELANRCVVSIASSSVMWRTNKKSVEFRELVAKSGGTIKTLPEGSFKESGTNVNTCVVHIEKGSL
ncbi:MAG: SAM-dependent methyltransferase [bacterium]|nr:SAM-dependent methyltransferase [bacterium]